MTLMGMNVMVTGASRGIGRQIALAAAKSGARVGINYLRSEDEAKKLAEQITGAGLPEPEPMKFDATSLGQVEEAVERFAARFGAVNGWVNNAAVNIPGLLAGMEEEDIRAQIDSALVGPALCLKAVIPHMMRSGGGSVVNIGSAATGRVFRGQSLYLAAKGGLEALTRALAFEYGRKGIRVNLVAPGPVDTDMMAFSRELDEAGILGRTATGQYVSAESVAQMVVFLLSPAASSVTGARITVDGGYSL